MKSVFLLGCGKCGTTTLAHLLNQHPQVAVSVPKELNFFNDDEHYRKGMEYYSTLFAQKDDACVRVDASVCYSLYTTENRVCERIQKHFTHPRFIYIARSPYARMESIFRLEHHRAYRTGLFMPFSLREGLAYHPPNLLNSLYWQRTSVFRTRFGDNAMLYLTTEDLAKCKERVLQECFDFLEVSQEKYPPTGDVRRNTGDGLLCDTQLLRLIRRRQSVWSLHHRLPGRMRNLLLLALRRPNSCLDLSWTEEMKAFMSAFFKQDVAHYLQAAQKTPEYWGEDFAE